MKLIGRDINCGVGGYIQLNYGDVMENCIIRFAGERFMRYFDSGTPMPVQVVGEEVTMRNNRFFQSPWIIPAR